MITANKVVAMNYVLKDKDGNILDSSDNEPLEFLQGHENIIPGLEKALNGLTVGDKKQVEVSPEEGYGEYQDELQFELHRNEFGTEKPEPGMAIQLNTGNGESFLASIVSVDEEKVHVDANHPLAGKTLYFDVEIKDIRDASPEEISHGHPHGPHGHHHH